MSDVPSLLEFIASYQFLIRSHLPFVIGLVILAATAGGIVVYFAERSRRYLSQAEIKTLEGHIKEKDERLSTWKEQVEFAEKRLTHVQSELQSANETRIDLERDINHVLEEIEKNEILIHPKLVKSAASSMRKVNKEFIAYTTATSSASDNIQEIAKRLKSNLSVKLYVSGKEDN